MIEIGRNFLKAAWLQDLMLSARNAINRSFTCTSYSGHIGSGRGAEPVEVMVTIDSGQMVDWSAFQAARSELGAGFVRILGYFKEDGVKSVAAIEEAMRAGNAAAIVLPAHTLKGESHQFGAEQLAAIAEAIEVIGRQCVETRDAPDQALEHVVKLRPTFEATLAMLEREANPLVERRPTAFGRRAI